MNWKSALSSLSGNDKRILRDGIRILARAGAQEKRKHPLTLPEQPFDSLLLRASPLFRKSRKLFLDHGGHFRATVVSSPRTLTSPILLSNEIEYTPIERELIWAATDRVESASAKTLLQTRTLCTSLFHEQNHRILWNFLPAPSSTRAEVTRYLNAVESFIVTLDMALGDELTHDVSRVFYLAGVTYDPGTGIRAEGLSRREYRNYLHAALYATYLKLQFFTEADITKAAHHLYPQNRKLTERAIQRALRLDDDFVRITNPNWQRKHMNEFIRQFSQATKRALIFPDDPIQNHVHYLWAERWFDKLGV